MNSAHDGRQHSRHSRLLRESPTALLFALLSACLVAFGQEPPKTMTRMVVYLVSADVPKDSFPAKPRTLYRSGSKYCRIEEMPDEPQGIHGLTIINEPDVWMVNRFDNSAKHIVDAGPTFNCRLPIFAQAEWVGRDDPTHNKIMELEFGREREFFTANKAREERGPDFPDGPTRAYILTVGDIELLLVASGEPERPRAVALIRGQSRDMIRYSEFEEIPFDAALFARPEGIVVQEQQ